MSGGRVLGGRTPRPGRSRAAAHDQADVDFGHGGDGLALQAGHDIIARHRTHLLDRNAQRRKGRIEMGERVILNLQTFADGHRPPDLALPGMD